MLIGSDLDSRSPLCEGIELLLYALSKQESKESNTSFSDNFMDCQPPTYRLKSRKRNSHQLLISESLALSDSHRVRAI